MQNNLLADDGENRAVRGFLMLYCEPGLTVGAMRRHLEQYEQPHWPEWVENAHHDEHLNKAAAQAWLRYLFELENSQFIDASCNDGDCYVCKLCGGETDDMKTHDCEAKNAN